ncbi:glycosyltransferase [Rathayibacter sp. PhB185]|uniref:glycosyltransferase n=1 Tax=Rathayibacter sp. PhB185 TaxID=2485198 RepID=UPI000FB4AAFF|nr:glycosyltransferase [Rathayibacter sp. PhB185]ROP57729.1 glycosyltransferase involved in cell wall biosynthesis [Rathayibacter sp. PhB186]ROS56114.1 glycosyltransferase involved in cell wall biosynthesis [Rathayibacter sp. PhB185]
MTASRMRRGASPVIGGETVVHVAESFAGGVSAAVRDYVGSTPQYRHELVYAPRDDAPLNIDDLEGFERVTELPGGTLARVKTVRSVVRRHESVVVHAHSSFAGVYARLAVRKGRPAAIVYTPHCYGFERRDVSAGARSIYRVIEGVLALNTSGYAACSPREAKLSHWPFARATSSFVPNVAPLNLPGPIESVSADGALRVVGAGRLAPQKDPDFFVECVGALRAAGLEIDAVWIGGGNPVIEDRLRRGGVTPTGWLARTAALEELRAADLYIHSAAWEGFPIAVLEAAALGVPTIARRIPAFEGVDMPELFDSPQELGRLRPVLESERGRRRLLEDLRIAVASFSRPEQARVLTELYERSFQRMRVAS